MFRDIKKEQPDPAIIQLLAACVYENSPERAQSAAEEYRTRHNRDLFGWVENGEIIGMCGFRVYHTDRVVVTHIATRSQDRGRGIGQQIIQALQAEFLLPIHAETDDDAVGFYRKLGFETTAFEKTGHRRWACVLEVPHAKL